MTMAPHIYEAIKVTIESKEKMETDVNDVLHGSLSKRLEFSLL